MLVAVVSTYFQFSSYNLFSFQLNYHTYKHLQQTDLKEKSNHFKQIPFGTKAEFMKHANNTAKYQNNTDNDLFYTKYHFF